MYTSLVLDINNALVLFDAFLCFIIAFYGAKNIRESE
jgi:hypothetical protein